LNVASACELDFYSGDIGDPKAPLQLILDASAFDVSKGFGLPREDIVRASLECLRLCLPEKLRGTPVTLKSSDTDTLWMSTIVSEFNTHDRNKVFFTSTS
jgi:hypothetical protein